MRARGPRPWRSLGGPHLGGRFRIGNTSARPRNARAKRTRTSHHTTIDPQSYTPSGPPDALRARPSPCKRASRRFWWLAVALTLLSALRASLRSTSGPRLLIDLLPTLARKTLFVSLRETSSLPFVHMDSPLCWTLCGHVCLEGLKITYVFHPDRIDNPGANCQRKAFEPIKCSNAGPSSSQTVEHRIFSIASQ